MNDIAHKQMVQKAVSAKFGSHQRLYSKAPPIYPAGVERESQRLSRAYMSILQQTMKECMPEIIAAAKREKENARTDGNDDLIAVVNRVFSEMRLMLSKKSDDFSLRSKLEKLANLNRKLSIREWKRAVKATIGLDLMDDYYNSEFFRDTIPQWIDDNVNLITSVPKETLDQMQQIVTEGYRKGKSTTQISKEVRERYGVGKRKANLLARDQIAKLNGQLAQKQQQDAGCEEYIWSTSEDSRVRDSHRVLDGKKFRWDTPPDVGGGRHCNPGEDYQCRCVALPVFDIETLNVPMAQEE